VFADSDPHRALLEAVSPERERLLMHPLYAAVSDARALRTFMQAHVFAVWDFMSLLKALQQRLTCVRAPWVPPRSRTAARLVNEIVLGEESDEVAPGVTMSHLELYLEAMEETGADTASIDRFVAAVREDVDVRRALELAEAPAHVRAFVSHTLATAARADVESIAASFFVGREDLVPAMFRRLLPEVERHRDAVSLRRYLARHIEVDEDQHGPLARRLLGELCGTDEKRWRAATEAARAAIVERLALWDGIVASLPS